MDRWMTQSCCRLAADEEEENIPQPNQPDNTFYKLLEFTSDYKLTGTATGAAATSVIPW